MPWGWELFCQLAYARFYAFLVPGNSFTRDQGGAAASSGFSRLTGDPLADLGQQIWVPWSHAYPQELILSAGDHSLSKQRPQTAEELPPLFLGSMLLAQLQQVIAALFRHASILPGQGQGYSCHHAPLPQAAPGSDHCCSQNRSQTAVKVLPFVTLLFAL